MTCVKSASYESYFSMTLNRPEKRNALSAELMEEVIETLKKFSTEISTQKYLLLQGEGPSFCAGADLSWMKSMRNYSFEENKADSLLLFDLFNSVYRFPLPVITLTQGSVYGGGLGFLAASDFVFAKDPSLFCFSEVKLGLIPSVISTFVLNKGPQALASAYMGSGQIFDIDTAIQMGLVQKIYSSNVFNETLKSYQNASTEALVACKKLIQTQSPFQPEDQREFTISEISKLRVSTEAQKRMTAFLDSRKKKK